MFTANIGARFGVLEANNFKTDSKNPLSELSELRFELGPDGQEFSLNCRFILGKMFYEYKDREYEVGVSSAYLRLSLEGCETTLGSAFGESVLEPVLEEVEVEAQVSGGVEVTGGTNLSSGAQTGAQASAGACGIQTRRLSQSKLHLPVIARPNDSWEVRPTKVALQTDKVIEGTAIPSVSLCTLRRKQGGNRMSVIGEVQVSKKALKVSAKGGNRIGKAMSEWQNKDSIVSLILKRAIQREATTNMSESYGSTVAISRCEIVED